MASTVHLNVTHLTESQSQKHVTVNDAFDRLDGAIAGLYSVDVVGGETIAENEAVKNLVFDLTGTLGGNVTVTVPDAIEKLYFVKKSATGGNVDFETVSGTGVTLTDTDYHFLYADGTNVIELSLSAAGGVTLSGLSDTAISAPSAGQMLRYDGTDSWDNEDVPYDVGGASNGNVALNDVVLRFIFPRAATMPNGATDSQAKLGVAATGGTSMDFDVQKNGAAAFATISFAATGTGAFTMTGGDESFSAGDVLTITCTQDDSGNTGADLSVTLAMTRD